MQRIKKKSNIGSVFVNLFGNTLAREMNSIGSVVNEKYEIPFEIEFNSSWRVSHSCGNCHHEVSFGENYDAGTKEYKLIKGLNSTNYTLDFLNNLILLFNGLELGKVNGEFYLNRQDFQYEFDIQRMTSVAPILYNCPNCKTEYLAIIRVGMPQLPERNMPSGIVGKICIDEIIQIEVEGSKRFIEVAEERSVNTNY